MTEQLQQITIDQIPRPEVPGMKIRKIGRRARPISISQGDLMAPEKIKIGNLPQDQKEIF
jgi:hypothetical protein